MFTTWVLELSAILLHKHYTKNHRVPYGIIPQVVREYNNTFSNESDMQVKYKTASKYFLAVTKRLNEKWHPQEMQSVFYEHLA